LTLISALRVYTNLLLHTAPRRSSGAASTHLDHELQRLEAEYTAAQAKLQQQYAKKHAELLARHSKDTTAVAATTPNSSSGARKGSIGSKGSKFDNFKKKWRRASTSSSACS
jgi:membrane-bound inhibitor of C-type lysozyme